MSVSNDEKAYELACHSDESLAKLFLEYLY